jgi:phage terminase small subunit
MSKELNPKQLLFCNEYIVDFNGTQAAMRAGYTKANASSLAYQLLQKPLVQKKIQELFKLRAAAAGVTQERVVFEISRLAFTSLRGAYNEDGSLKSLHQMDPDTAATISGIDTTEEKQEDGKVITVVRKVRRYDKIRALEMLAKHLGVFDDDEGEGLNVRITRSGGSN